MMKFFRSSLFYLITYLLFVNIGSVNGQTLQESIQRIRSLKNISYTDVVRTKFSFQEDFSVDTLSSHVLPTPEEAQTGGCYLIKGGNNSYAFDGNKLISLNYADSTYKIQKESVSGQHTRSLLYWTNVLEKSAKQSNRVRLLADTLINNTSYAHIEVIDYDSIAAFLKISYIFLYKTSS
ncbi:hypothetical protein GCM10023231_17190 [Olivibacter ginsenosidimutans]|uniref:Uncharacterized protein n=1 Tax=Olivibacter ginsenosidimutans TaxID=1176537 RepID=A0ABP9B3D2_9SPHI